MLKFSWFQPYIPLVKSLFWIVLLFRTIETVFLISSLGWSVLPHEMLGFLLDLILAGGISLLFFPLFYLLNQRSSTLSYWVIQLLLYLFSAAHFLILTYFLHQHIPLDTFLYQHPYEEIYFTLTTSGIPLTRALILIGILSLAPSLIYWRISRKKQHTLSTKKSFYSLLICAFVSIFILLAPFFNSNYFSLNKSIYFYSNSIQFALSSPSHFEKLDAENIAFFQAQYPHKKFISKNYPLLHERNKNDELYKKLKPFDTIPNVVLLIVEGLGDDYIHRYHSIYLMPFLNQLKDSSLYWEKCFTLGERSFAALPSLLGGLPYGNLGFTLLENYPQHHTLINVLNAKNYHTAFYYGQGAWFHRKNVFLNYNNIDWIVDKAQFNSTFNKILFGEEAYFWGYNDKDLYQQFFKTLDSLPKQPYFNVFFTGTSHSPYVISDEEYYDKKLISYTTEQNKQFITTYHKYLRSLIFVDDAIRDFFEQYSKREEFSNTIFIITGDHPMSELPRKNELKKYHVPLFIYSPKLISAQRYRQTVSHLDIYETLLSLLEHYTGSFSSKSAALGSSLFDVHPKTTRKYAFMDGNRGMYEYYADGYYLRHEDLYKVNDDFSLESIENKSKKEQLKKELKNFKTINYRTSFDHLIMDHQTYVEGLDSELYFSKIDSNLYSSSDEYNVIIPSTEVPNQPFRAELTLDLKHEIKEGSSIVFQVKDAKDSILSWKNIRISEKKKHQFYVDYPYFQGAKPPFIFSGFIWNQKNEQVIYKNVNALLYQLK